MKKTTRSIVLIAAFLLAAAATSTAQPLGGKVFVAINGGGQMSTDTLTTGNALTIYNQTASWTATENIDGGGMFDFNVGYKVWKNLGIGIGFSRFDSTGSTAAAALVPSPVFFNQPNSVTLDVTTAPRDERNVYLVAVWFVPIRDKIDLAISIGPSFIRVEQQVVTDIIIPLGTSNALPVVATQSGTANGLNVGIEGAYMFLPWVGVGAFTRFNGGSVDLDQVSDVKAGGFQAGIGARLRF